MAEYAGVEPENVVLGAGADDLILLSARAFAGAGDEVAIASQPTYPLYRIAAGLVGAEVGDDRPVVTFCCRPNNPTGELEPLPAARPLVVDEAYFEYAGETAVPLIDDDVVVIRTFSKAFGLAGARVGYALAGRETAAELNRRQAPLPVSTLSAALALAALDDPPDVDRRAGGARAARTRPPRARARAAARRGRTSSSCPSSTRPRRPTSLLRSGVVVRTFADGIRITVRDREDDDLLLEALARSLDRPAPVAEPGGRRARHRRARRRRRASAFGSPSTERDASASRPEPGSTTTCSSSSRSTAGSTSCSRGRATSRRATTTRPRTPRSRSARRSTGRSATAAGSRATATQSCPMDDALARAAVDLGGRPCAELGIDPDPGLAEHVLQSLAQSARMSLHVDAKGRDAHHTAEAAFKAVGRALRVAVRQESTGIPSTKGTL